MMLRKGAFFQGLVIFGSYVNMFVFMFCIQYIQSLYATKNDDLIALAGHIGTFLGIYLPSFYGSTIIYWAYSYFETFKRGNQMERHNITLKDTISIKKFEGIGIVSKKLIKYSKLNIESCFKDRELVKLYEKLKERIKIKYTKDIQELTQKNEIEQTEQIEYEMDFE